MIYSVKKLNKRFLIRDIETKKTLVLNRKKMDFRSLYAAVNYMKYLEFGLREYYEIYDIDTGNIMDSKLPMVRRRKSE